MPTPTDDDLIASAAAIEPIVRRLTEAMEEAIPSWWKRARLVISFVGVVPRIESPDGHKDTVVVTPRLTLGIRELTQLRRDARLNWTSMTLDASERGDGSWHPSVEWTYPDRSRSAWTVPPPMTSAPAERPRSHSTAPPIAASQAGSPSPSLPPLPSSFPPAETLPAAARARVEALVQRAEQQLAGSLNRDAQATLGAAVAELPGDPLHWREAGWLFNRLAGVRLGTGDSKGARRAAQQALQCAGWEADARALLRLGQAELALGLPEAAATLVRARDAGGAEWFGQVAPELVVLVGRK